MAAQQEGLITRAQLAAAGIDRWAVAHRIESERWQLVAPRVVAVTTGELSREQRWWRAVLHGGNGALLADLTALAAAGLAGWPRDEITVLIPASSRRPAGISAVRYRKSRRDLRVLRDPRGGVPRCMVEPAALLFASAERSERTSMGLLAAVVQQRLTSSERLRGWLDDLAPLRRSRLIRQTLLEIGGGAQSLGELDVRRMCRAHRIAAPRRQHRRLDARGRVRFTDCEWSLADGRVLVLEVDGAFHMDVERWEDDIARQRALTAAGRAIVRCSTRELRDEPDRVARDLIRLGVPRS